MQNIYTLQIWLSICRLMFGTNRPCFYSRLSLLSLLFVATEPFMISNVGLLGLYSDTLWVPLYLSVYIVNSSSFTVLAKIASVLLPFTVLNHTVHYSTHRDCSDLDADLMIRWSRVSRLTALLVLISVIIYYYSLWITLYPHSVNLLM